MLADLSRFKVIYNNRVLNAIAIEHIDYYECEFDEKTRRPFKTPKPRFLAILVINEDGNIELIDDETWRFQFIPIISGERKEQ